MRFASPDALVQDTARISSRLLQTCCLAAGSSPVAGSSRKSTSGVFTKAAAISHRLFRLPDRCSYRLPKISESPSFPQVRSTFSLSSFPGRTARPSHTDFPLPSAFYPDSCPAIPPRSCAGSSHLLFPGYARRSAPRPQAFRGKLLF